MNKRKANRDLRKIMSDYLKGEKNKLLWILVRRKSAVPDKAWR